jgi:DNA-binding LytR/AlgR family response regulator
MTTAIIAEDEPLLRRRLRGLLEAYWPELEILAEAGDGAEALAAVNKWNPDIAFLDIQMPKLSGIEVAHAIRGKAHIVFLTAHAEHAVDAFAVAAVDYLLKPLQPGRLVDTIERLKAKTSASVEPPPPARTEPELPRKYLTWIQASVGNSLRLITVKEIVYFQSDARYTRVVTARGEHFVRKTIKELTDELNPEDFVQISRGCIVNLHQVDSITRAEGQMEIHLKAPAERLAVSPSYQSAFKQM